MKIDCYFYMYLIKNTNKPNKANKPIDGGTTHYEEFCCCGGWGDVGEKKKKNR